MITELTDEQTALLPVYRDKWMRIGLSTEPADRPRAEEAIAAVYHAANLPAPRIVWCGSPLSQGLVRALYLQIVHASTGNAIPESVKALGGNAVWATAWDGVMASVGTSVRNSVWDSVMAPVGASVGADVMDSVGGSVANAVHVSAMDPAWASARGLVRDSVWASVRESVGVSVWYSVRDSVWPPIGDTVRDSVKDSVRASVWDSVRDSVWASVGDSARDSAWASVGQPVKASVEDSVWASVREFLWATAGASVLESAWASVGASASAGDSVRASVAHSVWDSARGRRYGDSVRGSVQASVGDSVYGQHDAGWLGFCDFLGDVVGLKDQTSRLQGLMDYAQCAGWFLPHAGICWCSERPNRLHRDERGRLHSIDGPSIEYPDGFRIYAWHGIRLPAHVIEKRDEMTVKQILAEKNTEVRRAMRNLYGNERFMQDAGATTIDRADKHGAALLSLRLPGDPVDIRFMRMTCPTTGSQYLERVPPDVSTAMQGLSWRFQVSPEQYKPLQET